MAEEGERIYLGSRLRLGSSFSSSNHRRSYGSCTVRHQSAMLRNIKIIKHKVEKGDTLQGIALKYGVTMEDIKRENRMWTTDSLFLREFLDIPVPMTQEEIKAALGGNGAHSRDVSPQRAQSLDATPSSPPSLSETSSSQDEENIRDFLGRIDTSIKKTKSQIKELNVGSACSSSYQIYDDDGDTVDDLNLNRAYSANGGTITNQNTGYSYQNGSRSSLSDLSQVRSISSSDYIPKTTVVTSGRKVKTCLQKHHREHEQMFEL